MRTFIAMPGLMKTANIDDTVANALTELSLVTGIPRERGFSTYGLMKSNHLFSLVDRWAQELPNSLYSAYGHITMHMCLQSMRKHDDILALLPLPIVRGDKSFTLGVAIELADAFEHQMPVSVATFDRGSVAVSELYRPNSCVQLAKHYSLTPPEEWHTTMHSFGVNYKDFLAP
ncbi:hypothetical protein JW868_04310 [Candidatus Woesearchaeota archaeon]|nr:hypothetical protein [Candidatus Woesearchaeota archaeon]